MSSTRRTGSNSRNNASGTAVGASLSLPLAGLSCALFVALSCTTTPAAAFVASPRPASVRSADARAEGIAPLFGIKRKVKAEIEENYSGKVVEPAGAASSMFGSDSNALFDVIEKNKKRAAEAEAAAAAALGGGDADGDGEEEEGEEGGREGEASISGDEA